EWRFYLTTLLSAKRELDLRVSASAAGDRLARVIRSARQLSGGAYTRWQHLLDRNDVPGLVAFAGSPEGLSFRPTLLGALGQDLLRAKQQIACRAFLRAALDRFPHDVWLHTDLAQVCLTMRPADHAEALRHLSAASSLRHDNALFHMQLGGCYL